MSEKKGESLWNGQKRSVNMAVSFMALWRSDERSRGMAAEASWQQVMDERFGDDRLVRIYPNAIKVE